ncbi:hypothetical protein [Natrinema sp. 1APR25-10V2]|uniref:hypothetical protein n=1 Tax=Natrinema sp. 1APR25-10V2 TaxID=2951081 RepID=UPI0028772304|nr:hypothetical protein [Natrinema sp. 1APR25-10V2]MDS0476900.1 hypothetical protein [Natrinema sp. 1APR25-10V2]
MTYTVVGVGASLPYVFGLLTVIMMADPDGIWGPPILTITAALSLCYIVAILVISVFSLPRLGIGWDPNGYSRTTWAVFIAGSIWYATIFAVPLIVLGLLHSLPGGY